MISLDSASDADESEPSIPRPGRMLGKYRLGAQLGAGGMGVVLEAVDTYLQRAVAIKLLHPSVASDREAMQRFLDEARAVARLSHPHVVPVFEIDRDAGTLYIVMELLRGGTLQARLEQAGPLPWAEATRHAASVARALEAAHAAGMVHRDVKPSNILLDENGSPKLGDFGLVKRADPAAPGLTSLGVALGTPHFMSPEQCRGERVDARSDVYSLGATYYALMTGQPPFPGAGLLQIQFSHCSSPAPDPRRVQPLAPEACATIVRRAMAKEPCDRYAGAAELAQALEALQRAESAPAPSSASATERVAVVPARPPTKPRAGLRRWAVVAAALVLLLLVAGAWRFWPEPARPENDIAPEAKVAPKKNAIPAAQAKPPAGDPAARWNGPLRDRIVPEGLVLEAGGRVRSLAFSSNGRWLGVARFLDKKTVAGFAVLDCADGAEKFAAWPDEISRSVAFAPGSDLLAACGRGRSRGVVHLRRVEAGIDLPDLPGPPASFRSLAFSPDGKRLVVGLDPHTGAEGDKTYLTLWDVATRAEIGRVNGVFQAKVNAVAFSDDCKRVFAGAEDGFLRVFDADTRVQLLARRVGPSIFCLAPVPGSKLLAVGKIARADQRDTGLDLVDADDLTPIQTLNGDTVFGLAVSGDGRWLAAGGSQHVTVWDLDTRRLAATLRGHRHETHGVAFSPDGTVLATGSFDETIRLWDVSGLAKLPR